MEEVDSHPNWRLYEFANNALVCKRLKGYAFWHWHNVPTSVLIELGWLTVEDIAERRRRRLKTGQYEEYGVDGVVLLSVMERRFAVVQSKLYQPGGRPKDLGHFCKGSVSTKARGNPGNMAVLCLTPGSRLTGHTRAALDNPGAGWHVWEVPIELEAGAPKSPVREPMLPLRPVQQEALAFLEHSPRALLNEACTTGKTLVAGHHIAQFKFDLVVVASPLRAPAEQNTMRLAAFMPEGVVTVRFWSGDAGTTTDAQRLRDVLAAAAQPWKPVLVGTTFASASVVASAIQAESGGLQRNALALIDEAHNLGDPAEAGTAADLLHLAESELGWRVLLMTATPRRALMDLPGYDTFSYSPHQAIADGACCDYRIVLPLITGAHDWRPQELEGLDMVAGGWDAVARAVFLAGGMLHHGCGRSICLLSNKHQCCAFAETFHVVCTQHLGVRSWCGTITEDTNGMERRLLLEAFQAEGADRELRILCSIRILDEAIDVPRCDSVFFGDFAPKAGSEASLIRLVQRLSRAMRLDPTNPHKVARAFAWTRDCDEDVLGRAMCLLHQADRCVLQKVEFHALDYDRAVGDAEVEQLRHEQIQEWLDTYAVRAVGARELVQAKVDALATCTTTRPKRREMLYAELEGGVNVAFDGGMFVTNILPRWSGGAVQANTAISEAQMKQLMEGCWAWLPEAMATLRAKWAAGYGQKAPTQAKVDALIACTARPKTGEML